MIKKLLVEGWRGINHSYAMVNQYQTLEFAKSNVDLYHNDVPFFVATGILKKIFVALV